MVIADTDIFIASVRDNALAKTLIRKYADSLTLSAITAMELYVGANNPSKKKMVDDLLKCHFVIPVDKATSNTAIRLLREHNTFTRKLLMPDALIAATCLVRHATLLTFNTRDFKFIKGLKLAK